MDICEKKSSNSGKYINQNLKDNKTNREKVFLLLLFV